MDAQTLMPFWFQFMAILIIHRCEGEAKQFLQITQQNGIVK